MKTQVINLRKREDRLNTFLREVPECVGPVKVFEAYDGLLLEKTPNPMLHRLKTLFCQQSSFRPGELGCWASHLAVWTMAANDNVTVIFEDDNHFYPNFTQVQKDVIEDFQKQEKPMVVYFGGGSLNPFKSWFPPKEEGPPSESLKHCVQGYHPKTFNAQAINQAMAQCLLEELNSCHEYKPVDVFMEHYLRKSPPEWSQHVSPHICYSTPGWSTNIHTIPELLGFSKIQNKN